MGSGHWSVDSFFDSARTKRAAGVDTFDYSKRAIASGVLRAHQTLDPQGLTLRESRDNADHPNSTAIIISLDVTGSMGKVVREIHANLPHLLELLLGHNYVSDPQILFAAAGDATCDQVPLQVGQFESDNRMDQNLENMVLEGGGGGGHTESYELTLFVAARHTATDCFEKRQKKGYLFIIGDEIAYPRVRRDHIRRLIGSHAVPPQDIALETIVAEVRQKFEVFFVMPGGASHGHDKEILVFWDRLLGEDRVIVLKDPKETSRCIATLIGTTEGTVRTQPSVDARETPTTSTPFLRSIFRFFGRGPVKSRKRRL